MINYTETPDWDAKARKLTDGRGVDCIVEIGGPRTIAMSLSALAVDFEAMNRAIAVCPQAKMRRGHSCRASGCPFHRAPAASIELIAQLRRDILRYQPIQIVGGEATTTVGQRRSESPLLLQAHRLTLASPAAGPELKHAGEWRSAIHAIPVLVKTPAG